MPRRDVGDGGEHVAVRVLEHGVPALQRGQRRERPGARPVVGDLVDGPVEPVDGGPPGPLAQGVDLVGPVGDQRAGVGQGGPGPQRGEQGALALEPAGQRRSQPLAADRRRCAAPRRRPGRRAWRRRSAWRRARRRPGRAAAGRARGRSPTRRGCGTSRRRGSGPRRRRAAGPRPPRHPGRRRSRRRARRGRGGRSRRSPRPRRACPAWRRTPSRRPPRASGAGRSRPRRARRRSRAP